MIEFNLDSHRGSFRLQAQCKFAAPWTVIFGPSGAGKSTLLRLLAGLDRPIHGHVALDNLVLTNTTERVHIRPGRRRMALVVQQPALFPHLSVAANVGFGLAGLDRNQRIARIEEMLKLVDASELIQRSPRTLSGGEAQRVALARALAPLPRLLLLDEPFSALDGMASDALLLRLQTWLCKNEVQTVLVTHDATDAYATEAEVVLLNDGHVTALGTANDALAAERDRIIKRLAES